MNRKRSEILPEIAALIHEVSGGRLTAQQCCDIAAHAMIAADRAVAGLTFCSPIKGRMTK